MAAFNAACLSRPRWVVGAFLALLLHACGAPKAPPRSILAERCFFVSSALPLTLRMVAPRAGMLRIGVRQRGISLTAELSEAPASTATVSPVDRYGEMTLLAGYRQGRPDTLRVLSRDSPDITGQACVSTELIDSSDRVRLATERAFADGRQYYVLAYVGFAAPYAADGLNSVFGRPETFGALGLLAAAAAVLIAVAGSFIARPQPAETDQAARVPGTAGVSGLPE